MEASDYRDAQSELNSARAELQDAEVSFRDTARGVAKAVGVPEQQIAVAVDNDTQKAAAEEGGNSDEARPSDVSELLMKALRECADRHMRAAELVPPEDMDELRTKLTEEAATWVGEGGEEFQEYLNGINYAPQPAAEVTSPRGAADDDLGLEEGDDFTPLDLVDDVVLNLREDEIKCFFKSDAAADADREESKIVVGSAHMSLETLRHMAEMSEDELPIFSTSSDHRQIGKMAVDIIPLSEDGKYPPFEDADQNPFVNSVDELVNKTMRFAVRVRQLDFADDGVLAENEANLPPPASAVTLPPGYIVRYKLPPQLRPTSIETPRSVESGAVRQTVQTFNHIGEWQTLADEEMLELLSSAVVAFEIVVCSSRPAAETAKTSSKKDDDAVKTPSTLRELLTVRANKHVDLHRRLEAEILRELTELAQQKEEREKFMAEYKAAFHDDVKHIKRTIEKLKEMLKESIHHKTRGTAKQMTAEHVMSLQENRQAVKRRMEEKLYNKTCAVNHLRTLELQNIASEIHNLKKRKQATWEHWDEAESTAKQAAVDAEKLLNDTIAVRDSLQHELIDISKLRADVNLSHVQAKKCLVDLDHNKKVQMRKALMPATIKKK